MKSFEEKVLEKCKLIPKGKVSTYKGLAKAVNSVGYRAVGQVLKKNKYPIKIPCHRVVNSDGSVGNYSGPGKKKGKVFLLRKEGVEIKEGRIDLKKYLFK
ncbi:MGMT family protein [Nanoarchaeota archaeon]